jgi:hypothetical protein
MIAKATCPSYFFFSHSLSHSVPPGVWSRGAKQNSAQLSRLVRENPDSSGLGSRGVGGRGELGHQPLTGLGCAGGVVDGRGRKHEYIYVAPLLALTDSH